MKKQNKKLLDKLAAVHVYSFFLGCGFVLFYIAGVVGGDLGAQEDISILLIGLVFFSFSLVARIFANLVMGRPWHGKTKRITPEDLQKIDQYLRREEEYLNDLEKKQKQS
ncbi:hypothetical protein QQM79_20670 [Marinobacteraceae bacterium S3BR75-40.1]